MKKILLTFIVLFFGLGAFSAGEQDALQFFNSYVKAANTYNSSLMSMYSDDAKIIRQVIKPDGQLVNVYFSINDYRAQMKISEKIAKVRNYKNNYSNIKVTKVANGYKIDAVRVPSTDKNLKFKSYFIVNEFNGKWLIVEELMQTKEQILLKYAK